MKIIKKPDFKFKKIRRFIFKGTPYKIIWKNKNFKGGHLGECDDPRSLNPEIRISPKACENQKELLAVIVDETVHSFWFIIEDPEVSIFSDTLADLLWQIGFRLKE